MTEKKKSKPNKLKKRTSQKSVFSKIMKSNKPKAPANPTPVTWTQATASNVAVRTADALPMTIRTQPQVTAPTILLPALDTDSSEDSSQDSSQGGPTVTTTLSTGVGGPPPPITISSPPPPVTTTKVKQPGGYRPATSKKKPVNMQGILTLRNFADDFGTQTRVFTKVADKHKDKDKVQLTVEALLRDNNNYITESQLVAKINALGDLVDQLAVSPVLPGGSPRTTPGSPWTCGR